jgi:16S rRNA (cytosine967-C5)-methyltransferase
MTPAARLSAAIEVLDLYLSGTPLEKALTNWARRSRFAGSKDRAALRDIVFGCVRRRASLFHASDARSGRGLVVGFAALDTSRAQVEALFSGEGHAPAPLSEAETQALFGPERARDAEAEYDLPAWLIPAFEASLGAAALDVAQRLRDRAPVFLRVNLSRMSRAEAARLLAEDGIATEPHKSVATALRVTENPRRVAQNPLYMDGVIELQDAASQAACAGLPEAKKMLDYCAGGGGKVLAYGARSPAALYAHDANQARLADLSERAKRAKLTVKTISTSACAAVGPFDLVLVDAPCSGSGTWRRAPEAKWSLTAAGLNDLLALQADILDQAADLVAEGGCLAYATCSVLDAENIQQVQSFLARRSEFELVHHDRLLPSEDGDGFFVAHLTKRATAS